MSEFAKLYESGSDQVLVLIQAGDEGPEVRVFFYPEDLGLGLCSGALQWETDNDEDWRKAERAFELMSEEKARGMVDKLHAQLLEIMPVTEA